MISTASSAGDLRLERSEESIHRLLVQVDSFSPATRHHSDVSDADNAKDEPKVLRRDVAILYRRSLAIHAASRVAFLPSRRPLPSNPSVTPLRTIWSTHALSEAGTL